MPCRSIIVIAVSALCWSGAATASPLDSLHGGPVAHATGHRHDHPTLRHLFHTGPASVDGTTPSTTWLALLPTQKPPLAFAGQARWPSTALLPSMQLPMVVHDGGLRIHDGVWADQAARPLLDRSWAVLPDGGLVQWLGTSLEYEAPAFTIGPP